MDEDMCRAYRIVDRAAVLRRWHDVERGVEPLPWRQLTDAQKLPWLLKAAAESGVSCLDPCCDNRNHYELRA